MDLTYGILNDIGHTDLTYDMLKDQDFVELQRKKLSLMLLCLGVVGMIKVQLSKFEGTKCFEKILYTKNMSSGVFKM